MNNQITKNFCTLTSLHKMFLVIILNLMESLEIQKGYLTELQKIKEKDVEVLLKKAYRGIWETAIKKYSDSAHFVYELLQNADDAKATSVEFILEEDGLWFKLGKALG